MFDLTEEQEQMRRMVHEFAVKEIRPVAAHHDETEEVPWDVMQKAHRLGLSYHFIPEEYGGTGIRDPVLSAIVQEELHWGCAGIAVSIMSPCLAIMAILGMGTEKQKKKWLPLFCDASQLRLGALCMTEPHAGSDVKAILTSARRNGDSYVLNGQKCFITNGGIADVHVVMAQTDPAAGLAGIAGFLVDKGTPGLSMGKKDKKMGCRASHTAAVILENCRIPVENRLGGEPDDPDAGPGTWGALGVFEATRPGVAAGCIGIARAAFEYALEYSKSRVVAGRPLASLQAISFKLADMAMEIDAARLLTLRACHMVLQGKPFTRAEGSMAKCYAADMAMRVTGEAVQILGGHGYVKDHPVERWMRDAKLFQIWEGTSEIQRIVIARALRHA